jgi:hypothetical protein
MRVKRGSSSEIYPMEVVNFCKNILFKIEYMVFSWRYDPRSSIRYRGIDPATASITSSYAAASCTRAWRRSPPHAEYIILDFSGDAFIGT